MRSWTSRDCCAVIKIWVPQNIYSVWRTFRIKRQAFLRRVFFLNLSLHCCESSPFSWMDCRVQVSTQVAVLRAIFPASVFPDGESDVMQTRVQGGLFQLHCHHLQTQDAHELFHGSNWIFQCGRQIYLSHVSDRTFASKYRMCAAIAATLLSSPETHRPIEHPGPRHSIPLRQCTQPSVDSSKRICYDTVLCGCMLAYPIVILNNKYKRKLKFILPLQEVRCM